MARLPIHLFGRLHAGRNNQVLRHHIPGPTLRGWGRWCDAPAWGRGWTVGGWCCLRLPQSFESSLLQLPFLITPSIILRRCCIKLQMADAGAQATASKVKKGAFKEADQHEKAYQIQKGIFAFSKAGQRKATSRRSKHVSRSSIYGPGDGWVVSYSSAGRYSWLSKSRASLWFLSGLPLDQGHWSRLQDPQGGQDWHLCRQEVPFHW